MSYILTADHMYVMVDGRRKHLVRGDAVPDFPEEDVERLTAANAIAPKGSPAAKAAAGELPVVLPAEPYVAPADQATPVVVDVQTNRGGVEEVAGVDAGVEDVERPATVANKPTLIAWLLNHDPQSPTPDQLDGLTKPKLWERIDVVWDQFDTDE